MPFIAMLLSGLMGALAMSMASLVGRVLLALSIGFVTFTGMDVGVNWVLDNIKSSIGGMPAEILDFLAWVWIDKAITMVFSAFTVALAFQMAGGNSLTKMVVKK